MPVLIHDHLTTATTSYILCALCFNGDAGDTFSRMTGHVLCKHSNGERARINYRLLVDSL